MADKGAIFKYMYDQNRPYSVTDIHMNLHKEYGKTAVQKCLDSLVEEGKVKEKLYGKQKVYVVNQDLFPAVDDAELKRMDERIAKLTAEVQAEETALREAESKLKVLTGSLTTTQAELALKECDAEIAAATTRLKALREQSGIVTTEEKKRIQDANRKMTSEWRKRKRLTMDLVDAIMEGYPKRKRDLFEEVGVETDEDVGVTLPTT